MPRHFGHLHGEGFLSLAYIDRYRIPHIHRGTGTGIRGDHISFRHSFTVTGVVHGYHQPHAGQRLFRILQRNISQSRHLQRLRRTGAEHITHRGISFHHGVCLHALAHHLALRILRRRTLPLIFVPQVKFSQQTLSLRLRLSSQIRHLHLTLLRDNSHIALTGLCLSHIGLSPASKMKQSQGTGQHGQ